MTTNPTTPVARKQRSSAFRFLFVHQIDEYPDSGRRIGLLGLAVIATIVLYYTYYTQTGVTPNILATYHMSFSFYVWIVILSNAIGAFASLPASQTDRLGRSNVVIYGLLIVGILITFGVPATHTEWAFATVICLLGLVEGAILVATPALVRDFSPQIGRASAMGFWTLGPVAGSLVVSVVAAHTLDHFTSASNPTGWHSQFYFSGITALIVFVLCLFLLKDLSSRLRDQLMVSMSDAALLEARARGISDEELLKATQRPWAQILKWDLVGSALGIALFLLVYYAAAGFSTIYWSTVFKNSDGSNFSVSQANGLNQWFWGAEIVALIVVGFISDKLKVRKPFMVIGSIGAIIFLILFLLRATHPYTRYSTLVFLGVCLAVCLSICFAPWMAAYTETVEAKNPALVATGLALWGWLLRLVVAISFIFLPLVINTVNPIIDNQPDATPQIQAFLKEHPASVAFATSHAALLTVIKEHQAVVNAVAKNSSAANIAATIKAIGAANFAQLVANEKKLDTLVVPYTAQLDYLSAHSAQLTALQNAVNETPKQWQHWYWVCVGGMVVFLPTIFLIKGRWSPRKAKQDEEHHEQLIQEELARLAQSGTPTATV
jgi:sugar phosphate permease